eukprot:5791712-Amphidinium_carterae.1
MISSTLLLQDRPARIWARLSRESSGVDTRSACLCDDHAKNCARHGMMLLFLHSWQCELYLQGFSES